MYTPSPLNEFNQILPMQLFMYIFCVVLVIILFSSFICLFRCERDLRGSLKSQKVWPKSNPLFKAVHIDSLPA